MDSIHGYSLERPYISSFFRELSPDWIDLSLVAKNFKSPRSDSRDSFRYLELGSGMGVTLVFLAAMHPQSSFLGIDYSPIHVKSANTLAQSAGVKNVSFIQGDIVEIEKLGSGAHSDLRPNSFDYVAAHGLYTWVSPMVQESILKIASKLTRDGGAFYCSYNCKPGWLPVYILKHLVEVNRRSAASSSAIDAYSDAISFLQLALGSDEAATTLRVAQPSLNSWIQYLNNQSPDYLLQEFTTEHWEPLFASDVHLLFSKYDLNYASSATLPDLIDELLPESVLKFLDQHKLMANSMASMIDISSQRTGW
jgi:SAM-dependent methyltransferase